jgi:MSHA pilin protein MshD
MCSSTRRRAAGLSLIEVVVFVVVLGIAFVGTLMLYNKVTETSVDPVIRKQTLAIAASLLEEIELRAFTDCDPDDPNVFTPGGPCTIPETIGPHEPSANAENRYADPRFDNVNDYHGFSMAGANIRGADGSFVGGLADYQVDQVTVANAGGDFGFAADAVLLITVTARHNPTGVAVSLQGYRFRYAPNSP